MPTSTYLCQPPTFCSQRLCLGVSMQLRNLKSSAYFSVPSCSLNGLKAEGKCPVLQPHVCFWPLALVIVTSCAEEGTKLSHHPLCPRQSPAKCLPRDRGIQCYVAPSDAALPMAF